MPGILPGMTRLLPILATLLALLGEAAASAPRCTPSREGEVACLDGKLCECRHEPGGSLTGRRPGTRWDCGALRPACGAAPMPADAGRPGEGVLPFLPPPYPPPGWR